MTKVIICGIGGKMGKALLERSVELDNIEIVAGIDKYANGNYPCPVFERFSDCNIKCDVVIDFSRPEALDSILDYCTRTGAAAVLAATGYSDSDIQKIQAASKKLPLFQSANMSLGVNLLSELCKKTAEFLGDCFEVEIVEKHHNKKVDSPSGTAYLLAESINQSYEKKKKYVYGRYGINEARTSNEIGIHAVRGGTIVGDHEVMFIGNDEIITLSHSASSKQVFATGAFKAAEFIKNKPYGLYDMKDIVKNIKI